MAKIFLSNLNYRRFLISIVFFNMVFLINSSAQNACFNADFSTGNFSNWTGSTGMNSAGDYSSIVTGIVQGVTNSGPTDPGRQTIMNLPGTDPNTGGLLSVLPPGGGPCARLGNENTNYEAERLDYTLGVSAFNCGFTYQYAVVLQDPGHPAVEQPKFTIHVLDGNGNIVDSTLGMYEISASNSIPGFNNYNDIRWKDWTSVDLDLSSFIGQNITIEFTTYDCAQGGHFGYAYISCYCGVPQLTQQCFSDSVIVTAPLGFSSYSWDTGDTTQSIIVHNPVAGDSVSCICADLSDTITLYAAVSTIPVTGLTATSAAICRGDTALITASGTYSYLWSNGQTTASISVAPTTTTLYTVTATSSGGCTSSAVAIVTVNPLPTGTFSSTPSYCSHPDGSLTFNPTVGTAPFLYTWNTAPQQNTQTATGLLPGTYSVTITDSAGCSSILSGSIAAADISLTVTTSVEHCGSADGTATVTATGGIPPYSYLWNTSPMQQTGQSATGLTEGIYYVTVTDGNCSATATANVINSPGPTAQITNIVNEKCGMNDGSAEVTVSGGTPPYNYYWNSIPTQNTPVVSNVPSGIYCVTVTDLHNCNATICDTIANTQYPAPEICMVTVDTATNHNMVVWEKPVTNGIDKYYVFRESFVAGVYNIIGTQNYSDNSIFIDTTSNSLQQSYRYTLAINDSCGLTSQQSNYHQTIHLSINAGMSGEWNLIWNNYEGFTFGTYNIYRGTNAGNFALLAAVSSNNTSYTDLTPPAGIVYYLIEAVRPIACNPSKTTNSITSAISNIADNQELGISDFDSNNFVQVSPNPGNGIFTLTLNQLPTKGLEITIYNSIGQLVKNDFQNSLMKTIDISDYPKGIYYLKISSFENYFFRKIVIE